MANPNRRRRPAPEHPAPRARMTRAISLTLLGAATLTACLCLAPGCNRRAPPDHTWYDVGGKAIPEAWTTDAAGKRVPSPHPHDRRGRPWVYDANGTLVPLADDSTTGTHSAYSSHRSSGAGWLWGGSGFRSWGGSSAGSPGARSGASSVSHGGFGSSGLSGG